MTDPSLRPNRRSRSPAGVLVLAVLLSGPALAGEARELAASPADPLGANQSGLFAGGLQWHEAEPVHPLWEGVSLSGRQPATAAAAVGGAHATYEHSAAAHQGSYAHPADLERWCWDLYWDDWYYWYYWSGCRRLAHLGWWPSPFWYGPAFVYAPVAFHYRPVIRVPRFRPRARLSIHVHFHYGFGTAFHYGGVWGPYWAYDPWYGWVPRHTFVHVVRPVVRPIYHPPQRVIVRGGGVVTPRGYKEDPRGSAAPDRRAVPRQGSPSPSAAPRPDLRTNPTARTAVRRDGGVDRRDAPGASERGAVRPQGERAPEASRPSRDRPAAGGTTLIPRGGERRTADRREATARSPDDGGARREADTPSRPGSVRGGDRTAPPAVTRERTRTEDRGATGSDRPSPRTPPAAQDGNRSSTPPPATSRGGVRPGTPAPPTATRQRPGGVSRPRAAPRSTPSPGFRTPSPRFRSTPPAGMGRAPSRAQPPAATPRAPAPSRSPAASRGGPLRTSPPAASPRGTRSGPPAASPRGSRSGPPAASPRGSRSGPPVASPRGSRSGPPAAAPRSSGSSNRGGARTPTRRGGGG